MRAGPVVIAYDASPAAERALRETGPLLRACPALVVVVHKAGLGWELVELSGSSVGLPPASIDVRTALEIDRALAERARRVAQKGAALARKCGFADAEGFAVADDLDTPVAETIVDVARERDARAIVVGAHAHGGPAAILGDISRDVVRRAEAPVIVVREI
jgi:nucleotide-binding universal stress UspA family protein